MDGSARGSTRRASSDRCSTGAAGSFRVGPYGLVVPLSVRYLPGTMVVETTWLCPVGLAGGARRPDDRAVARRPCGRELAHPAADRQRRRPHAGADDRVRSGQRPGRGRVRADVRLRRGSGGVGAAAVGLERRRGQRRRHLDSPALGYAARASRAAGPGRVTRWSRGSGGSSRSAGRTASTGRAAIEDAVARMRAHRALLARLAGGRALPGPPLARPPAPLGADAQGTDLRADRCHRRGRHDLAAGDARAANATGTTGTAGCATRPSPSGGCTRSASTGRPTTSCSSSPTSTRDDDGALQIMYGLGGERDLTERTLDHLTGYEGAAPVRVGNGAFKQKQNDVFGAGARLDLPPHQDGRPHPAAPVAGDRGPGHGARSRSGRTPTRGSGRHAASPSTTCHRS